MMICPYCSSSIADNSHRCSVCGGEIDDNVNYLSCTPLDEGTVIYSKYKIEKILGQGGFGITYLAYDEKLDRKVAIKEYFPDGIATRTGSKVTMPPTLDNKENLQNFKDEAKSIAKLKNQGIVDVYDVIEENGTFYIVMEYIEGTSLSSLLGKKGEKDAVEYVKQIAKAIGAVHAAGLLHQDIKPDNIILKDNGDIKIVDFGSSRVFTADKTKTYQKILTPGYAPLEQYGGKGKRGEYTDVYAICATLYALVKGVPPPEATDLAGGMNIDFSGLSNELKGILEKGLSVKIPLRISNTVELVKLFDEFENMGQGFQEQNKAGQNKYAVQSVQNLSKIKSDVESVPEKSEAVITSSSDSLNHKNFNKTIISIIGTMAGIIFIVSTAVLGYHYYMPSNNKINKIKKIGKSASDQSNSNKAGSPILPASSKPVSKPSVSSRNIGGGQIIGTTGTGHKIYKPPKTYAPPPIRTYFSAAAPSRKIFRGAGYEDFKMSGCFYCHKIYNRGKKDGYNLSHIGSRLNYSQIENQITHPSSSMPPNPNMPQGEVSQIAGWLENLK